MRQASGGGGSGTAANASMPKDQLKGQSRFNIEELLYIFTSKNYNPKNKFKHPPKGNWYASLHDSQGPTL